MARSSAAAKGAGPGTTTTGSGKTAVRSTMTPVFGKRAGTKRAAAKRSGRSR